MPARQPLQHNSPLEHFITIFSIAVSLLPRSIQELHVSGIHWCCTAVAATAVAWRGLYVSLRHHRHQHTWVIARRPSSPCGFSQSAQSLDFIYAFRLWEAVWVHRLHRTTVWYIETYTGVCCDDIWLDDCFSYIIIVRINDLRRSFVQWVF